MGPNPYLADQANAITQQATQNLQNNILPGIRSGAVANGAYGSSRQGIAEGNAIGQTNQGITNSLASLYGNAYNTDRSADLQQQSINNSYNLGLGNLGLGAQTADQNFYTSQRGQDLSQMGLGANLVNSGNTGLAGQGQQLYDIANKEYQAPLGALQNYGNILSQFSGLNQSNTQTTPGGSTAGNVAGGALTAAQLYKLIFGG